MIAAEAQHLQRVGAGVRVVLAPLEAGAHPEQVVVADLRARVAARMRPVDAMRQNES